MVRGHEWDVSRRLARAPAARRPREAGSAPALRLSWESAGGRAVLTVAGEVGPRTAVQLDAFIAEGLLGGCALLELDLAGMPSIGSAGLSTLVAVRRSCDQRGVEMRLRNASPSVERVVEAAGLDSGLNGPLPTGAGPGGHQNRAPQELALF
jgi:anti-anti-sigma factor